MTITFAPWRPFQAHPRALVFLFFTQMWERFSYYGMRALLVLYLTQHLLLQENSGAVLGYRQLEAALTAVFGPLSVQAAASQIYGMYEALVYLTPLLGGWLADRWLGQRRSVYLGGALIAAGHFLMASESAFFIALAFIVIGSGAFTPNVVTQVGALYPGDDSRRDSAFSLYYFGINIGAFAAPLICGSVGEVFGWHYGFSLAGVGMLIGLATFAAGRKHLPPDVSSRRDRSQTTRPAETARIWAALGILVLLSTLFWASYSQIGNVLNLWLLDETDRNVGSLELKVTWFQATNPLLILTLTPVLLALWSRQAARGREPSTVAKMALGCFFLATGYFILMLACIDAGGRVSWLWTIAYLVFLTLGELYLSPTSWSLFSRLAPPGMASVSMGVWFLALFAGSYLAGFLGMFWERLPRVAFWLLIASVAAAGGIGLLLLGRWLQRLMTIRDRGEETSQ